MNARNARECIEPQGVRPVKEKWPARPRREEPNREIREFSRERRRHSMEWRPIAQPNTNDYYPRECIDLSERPRRKLGLEKWAGICKRCVQLILCGGKASKYMDNDRNLSSDLV